MHGMNRAQNRNLYRRRPDNLESHKNVYQLFVNYGLLPFAVRKT
jgi:hypothetical protein